MAGCEYAGGVIDGGLRRRNTRAGILKWCCGQSEGIVAMATGACVHSTHRSTPTMLSYFLSTVTFSSITTTITAITISPVLRSPPLLSPAHRTLYHCCQRRDGSWSEWEKKLGVTHFSRKLRSVTKFSKHPEDDIKALAACILISRSTASLLATAVTTSYLLSSTMSDYTWPTFPLDKNDTM